MNKTLQIVAPLMLLTSYAAPQSSVTVQHLQVLREGGEVRIEVTLSGKTNSSVETAIHPDRIILILPNTISDAKQQRTNVDANGVRSVRIGLNSANPPVTRIVVDLDRAHPYTVDSQGARIVLRIQSATAASAHRSGTRPGSPVSDASTCPGPPASTRLMADISDIAPTALPRAFSLAQPPTPHPGTTTPTSASPAAS